MIMVRTKGNDVLKAVTGSKTENITEMTYTRDYEHHEYKNSQMWPPEVSEDIKRNEAEVDYFKSGEKLIHPFEYKFFSAKSLGQIIIHEVTVQYKIKKVWPGESQHLASSLSLIVRIIRDFEDSIDNSNKRKLYHLMKRVGLAEVLQLIFDPKSALRSPPLAEHMTKIVVYRCLPVLGSFLLQIILYQTLEVLYYQADLIKHKEYRKVKQESRQLHEATLKRRQSLDFAYGYVNRYQQEDAFIETQNSLFSRTKEPKLQPKLCELHKNGKTHTKVTLQKDGDTAQSKKYVLKQKTVRGGGDTGTKLSDVLMKVLRNGEKDISLNKYEYQEMASSSEYIDPCFINEDNDNPIAQSQTPCNETDADAENETINQASAQSTINKDDGRIPEKTDLGKPTIHSVTDGNKGKSFVPASHSPETGLDQTAATGLSETAEDDPTNDKCFGGMGDKGTLPETESEDEVDKEKTDEGVNDFSSESVRGTVEEHGAVCSQEPQGAEAPDSVPARCRGDSSEKTHEKDATAKGYRSLADDTMNGITSGSETGGTGTLEGVSDDHFCSQDDEGYQSHLVPVTDTSFAESDKSTVKEDDSSDGNTTSFNSPLDAGTPATDNRQSSETQLEQDNTTREVEDFVLSVKEDIQTASHATEVEQNVPECHAPDTSPFDQGALHGKESFPLDQGGTFSTLASDEQKLAPSVPSAPPVLHRQHEPELHSAYDPSSPESAEQERLEMDKVQTVHWTLGRFRPRDSAVPRPRHSGQAVSERPTIPRDLRQRMQERNFRIASMVHLGASLPLDVVGLAEAGIYYDEDKDEMCCCHCSWRMPLRDFCTIQTPTNTHSCRQHTGDDSVTVQGRESDRECERRQENESNYSQKSQEPFHEHALHARDLEVDDDRNLEECTRSDSESGEPLQRADSVERNASEKVDFEDSSSASEGIQDGNQGPSQTSEDTGEYATQNSSSDADSDTDTAL